MGTRILLTSKSDVMPGEGKEKITLMANKCCQMVWNRDFDKSQGDRLTHEGAYFKPNQRCFIVIDNGAVESKDYTTYFYKWKDDKFIPVEVTLQIDQRLKTLCPWNPADRNPGLTDEEFEATYGKVAYEQLVKGREEQLSK